MTYVLSQWCSQECIMTSPAYLKSSLRTSLRILSTVFFSFFPKHTHTLMHTKPVCVPHYFYALHLSFLPPSCLFDCTVTNGVAAVRTFALNYQRSSVLLAVQMAPPICSFPTQPLLVTYCNCPIPHLLLLFFLLLSPASCHINTSVQVTKYPNW